MASIMSKENVALLDTLVRRSVKSNSIPLSAEKVKDLTDSDIDYVRSKEARDNIWPSWKNATIQMQPLLDFVNRLLVDQNQTFTEIRERSPLQRGMFIETPYVVSHSGVYSSQTLKRRNAGTQHRHRLLPVEGLMNEALQLLLSAQEEERQTRWSQLNELLLQKRRSFPFLVFFGDHVSCDYHNHRDENNMLQSIPLFTFGVKANTLGCWNGFPIASYKMIRDAKKTPDEWDRKFEEWDLQYPWYDKIPKAVWRGSLTDGRARANGETPRSKLVALANTAFNGTSLFDIGFSGNFSFPVRNYSSQAYPIKGPIRPFPAFQNFVAVIDLDGNGWSSRFATQLCLNSVTLKVEPRFSDYFMGTQLQPGVHYVSIRDDLSDLLEKTLWIMLHPQESRQIIANARQWCRDHMIWQSIARDLLDSWEKYVMWMNEHDSTWFDVWEDQWYEWNQADSAFRPYKNSQQLSKKSLAGKFPSS